MTSDVGTEWGFEIRPKDLYKPNRIGYCVTVLIKDFIIGSKRIIKRIMHLNINKRKYELFVTQNCKQEQAKKSAVPADFHHQN